MDIQKYEYQINDSLKWLKKYKPEQYESLFLNFIEQRSKLKKIKRASVYNAGIAAFGASQVGKSYLMNNMLQKDGKPFMVIENGENYNFVEEINPITHDTEATGVVTRFSSFTKSPVEYSEEHPVLMKTLRVVDIILILCDGYFNDLVDYDTYSEQQINEMADSIYNQYIHHDSIAHSPISADDIFEMKAYFKDYINNAQAFRKSAFFDKIALVADKIPSTEWVNVFSTIWYGNAEISRLFKRLVTLLENLKYSEYLYLTTDAILHHGKNPNTIMSVECLNRLGEDDDNATTLVYIKDNNGQFTEFSNVKKSELSAICAEIVFRISDEALDDKKSYDLSGINDTENKEVLNHSVSKDILKRCDLMDFPGAKSRLKQQKANLQQTSILNEILLRGKVAYLFNMYNNSYLLNILLFCHDYQDRNVTELYLMIEKWIKMYIGKDATARKKSIEKLSNISPFFYIATKFNVDMQDDPIESKNQYTALCTRWEERFYKVLYNKCFSGERIDCWVNNWTGKDDYFQNSYLLRDFKYSGQKMSKLYSGFTETGKEQEMILDKDLYNRLRETFIESDYVQRFFKKPSLAWDVATTKNNDGALYIIEQLRNASTEIIKLRNSQFETVLNEVGSIIRNVMSDFYVPVDHAERIKQDIKKARQIVRDLDFTCNTDNYYVGHLMQSLQITETQCNATIHDTINNGQLNKGNQFNDYEIIHNTCSKYGFPIQSEMPKEKKWEQLIAAYGFANKEEAEDYLSKKNVDPEKLFQPTFTRKKNSCIIADSVFAVWEKHIKSVELMSEFSGENRINDSSFSNLTTQLIDVAKSQCIPDKMANAISPYADVMQVQREHESLMADILADIINNFVLDFGYSNLNKEQIESARTIAQENNMPTFRYIETKRPLIMDEQGLTQLFTNLNTNPNALVLSFEETYNRWKEYLVVSFISQVIVPNKEILESNEALQKIFNNL